MNSQIARRMTAAMCFIFVLTALALATDAAAQTAAGSSEASSVAKDALDPTASLMSIGFRDIVTTNYYGRSGSSNQIQFQPAIPFVVWGKSNIVRMTLPFNTGGVPGKGLGAIQIFNVTVFSVKGGRIGIGPVVNIPSNPQQTTDRFQGGPAIGYVAGKGKWTLGVFSQNLFSGDTQVSAIQPIVAYQLGNNWALSAGDAQWTIQWNDNTQFVNLPLGVQLSKVSKLGSQIVRYVVNPEHNARSVTGTPHWTVRFGFQLMVPQR